MSIPAPPSLRPFGCVRDEPDGRDKVFGASPLMDREAAGTVDGPIDHRPYDTPRVQFYESCVGHAKSAAEFLAANIAGTPIRFPSPAWAWAGARLLDDPGKPLTNRGCSLRNAFRWGEKRGIVAEVDYKETVDAVASIPPFDLWKEGENATLKAYHRIAEGPGSGALIRAALRRGICPTVAMYVDERFDQLAPDEVYDAPRGRILGGHAMVILGWEPAVRAFRLRNTWGDRWGTGGYGLVTEEFIERSAFDHWCPEIVPPL